MWSDNVRIFLTVVLSIAFLVIIVQKNIKRYSEGGIGKIRDEEKVHQNDIQIPGETFVKLGVLSHVLVNSWFRKVRRRSGEGQVKFR